MHTKKQSEKSVKRNDGVGVAIFDQKKSFGKQ